MNAPYSQSEAATPWHALATGQVASELGADPSQGLTDSEVAVRMAQVGPNHLSGKPPRPAWRKFLDQFRNFLVIVLIGAAVLAGTVGHLKDAIVIGVVVLLNATLGFVQEHRAETALAALKIMLAPVARVRRGGRPIVVPAEQLVPGDLLLLEAGDRIPADARVLSAHAAEVAEAALTGESHPVGKTAAAVPAVWVLADRRSMVYMNTVVTRGRIEAIVCATGMRTEMGKLAGLLAETADSTTPLKIQLDALGARLAVIAGAVVAMTFALGLARGDELVATAMTAIALAVAAIPEGLPAVVTVTLALGMHRMAKRHAIVRKLAAVETLGCTTVICADKTGTLTLNRMTAQRAMLLGRQFAVDGDGYDGRGHISAVDGAETPDLRPMLMPAALCADSRIRDGQLIGDPTEGALLALAAKGGIDTESLANEYPRIAEIPFDSAHKFMATFHYDGNVVRMWLKGAPDVLLARATRWINEEGEQRLDEAARGALADTNTAFAGDALRVLALAGRAIPAAQFDPDGDLTAWVNDLTLVGLVGLMDPPRSGARAAIATCRNAGIGVKMITGDHRITAAAIAHDLGLEGAVREGREIDGLSGPVLAELVDRTAVFARVTPEHKLAIVNALKSRGHVVAMTGDGVNDALALKAADIGVAMGITGTEVAKEAANLVLTDDNFATMVDAIKEGRTIYDNITKFVRFQLSTNIGAILTVLGAPLFGLPTPFTAIQILWVNIIMDGPPAMTLGVEPARPGVMNQPPRAADASILTRRRMARLSLYGLTMAVGTLAAYAWGARGEGGHAYAVTLAFTTFVLFQFFNIFNARAEYDSAFNRQFFGNRRLWLTLLGMVGLQLVVVHWAPAQAAFDTVDLTLADWALATLIASSVLFFDEIRKTTERIFKRRLAQMRGNRSRADRAPSALRGTISSVDDRASASQVWR